ncbi:MAG: ribosomal protein S18-alanine N-acetyltransferase [Spirochaetota bacterium]|mgnify:CR=1 FL=1
MTAKENSFPFPSFRPIRAEDADAVIEFVGAVPEIHVSRENIVASMNDPDHLLLIATAGAKIVGYLSARFMPPESEIFDIAVRADDRRTGVGKGLIDAFMREAASRGVDAFFLEVADDNTTAREFYGRCGFAEIAKRKDYYGAGKSAVVMKKRV